MTNIDELNVNIDLLFNYLYHNFGILSVFKKNAYTIPYLHVTRKYTDKQNILQHKLILLLSQDLQESTDIEICLFFVQKIDQDGYDIIYSHSVRSQYVEEKNKYVNFITKFCANTEEFIKILTEYYYIYLDVQTTELHDSTRYKDKTRKISVSTTINGISSGTSSVVSTTLLPEILFNAIQHVQTYSKNDKLKFIEAYYNYVFTMFGIPFRQYLTDAFNDPKNKEQLAYYGIIDLDKFYSIYTFKVDKIIRVQLTPYSFINYEKKQKTLNFTYVNLADKNNIIEESKEIYSVHEFKLFLNQCATDCLNISFKTQKNEGYFNIMYDVLSKFLAILYSRFLAMYNKNDVNCLEKEVELWL